MPLHGVLIALMMLLTAARASMAAGHDGSTPPNILFFITDDESAIERSAYGWSNLPTPAFDRVHANDYAGNFAQFLETRDANRPFFFWAGVMEPHEPSGPDNHLLLEKEFGVKLDDVSLPPFMEDTPRNRRARANFVYEICVAARRVRPGEPVVPQHPRRPVCLPGAVCKRRRARPAARHGCPRETGERGVLRPREGSLAAPRPCRRSCSRSRTEAAGGSAPGRMRQAR